MADNPSCEVCGRSETVAHLRCDCTRFNCERATLSTSLGQLDSHPSDREENPGASAHLVCITSCSEGVAAVPASYRTWTNDDCSWATLVLPVLDIAGKLYRKNPINSILYSCSMDVLARSGNTYHPLPFTRTRQVSPASQSKVRTQAHAEQATARDTVALAVSATTSSDVSASSSPQLLVSSSTVPPAAPPPATGASNDLPGASPHSTRTSPASSRPPSASPLPAPVPVSVSWSTTGPSAVPSRSQSLPSSSLSTPATTKATATVAPLPVAPQQAPTSRPGVAQVVSASPSPRTSGAPRLIQPKQPQILPKLSSGSANMTTPSAAATTRSQSPRAAQHKATPRPAPVPAPQPATTVQRGAAMGLNTGSPLLIGNPAAAQPGMFPAGPAHGTFLLNQYIPGLGHSPILIQGALGQTQSSLGQIQGVQLALRPPHATGLTLGPQTGPRPHGGHPGPPGTPTLVIPQNLGPRPNIFLAPPRMMSPPSFAIVPGQPLTLQQLQAMLLTQTTLAQPTLGAFQTDQHQSLVQYRRSPSRRYWRMPTITTTTTTTIIGPCRGL
ncbi:hypothetical protein HPB51_010760 [Rhipicephalus microplus]|uniref:Uncharacterized protein n=1 Tax=Rhipicephalus microplus TaxID=6941 RepID=A0A9J6DUG3_RHIMP|nr:hypothetical protein HPB51_010760 [Rhipicephalus microplus]